MGDDLWIGVKGQANSVIAGSPRNAFRCSVVRSVSEVEHWMSAKLRMPILQSTAVRPWGISFMVERETAQNAS